MTHLPRLMTLVLPAAALCTAPASGAQDPLLARNLAATCAACHGSVGAAPGGMTVLAGKPAAHIVGAMLEFKTGARAASVMQQIAKGYSDAQIGLIASYFAAQVARP